MKNLFLALSSFAILCGIAPAVSANEDPAIGRFIKSLAAVDIPASNISIVAQPLDHGGKTWFFNPNVQRLTASTAKLYTTYAALVRLGPATTLKTEVWQNGNEFIIVGSGDPSVR